jgi:tetratricopeptide (TPR) repeat protein
LQRPQSIPPVPPLPTVPVPGMDRKPGSPTPEGGDREAPPAPKKDKEKQKKPSRKPRPEPRWPGQPPPEDDPRDEHARLVRAGQEAFADEEYGRAAQRFRQAVLLLPEEPLAYFLLGQALLAQGSYHAAFDAIRDGLRLRPDWPTAGYRPIELYGKRLDEYAALIRATEKALARHPLDVELLFLRGYVLWFDGSREEARAYFRKALPRAAEHRGMIERFLRALPDEAGL